MKVFQKGARNAGKILQKASEIGGKVLDSVENTTTGAVDAVPGFGMAKAAVRAAGIAGKAAQGVSTANSIDSGLKSLSDAYNEYHAKPDDGSSTAPGAEAIKTGATA